MKKKRLQIRWKLAQIPAAALFLWGGLTATAHASGNVNLDLTKGDIEISVDGYRQNGGDLKDGPEDGSYVITSDGKETANVVTVVSAKFLSCFFSSIKTSFLSSILSLSLLSSVSYSNTKDKLFRYSCFIVS